MNTHEFQGKSILKAYNVDIQEGFVAETADQAVMVARQMQEKFKTEYFVVKAQIHAGGRGKGGGVKLAKSVEEVGTIAGKMLGMTSCYTSDRTCRKESKQGIDSPGCILSGRN